MFKVWGFCNWFGNDSHSLTNVTCDRELIGESLGERESAILGKWRQFIWLHSPFAVSYEHGIKYFVNSLSNKNNLLIGI